MAHHRGVEKIGEGGDKYNICVRECIVVVTYVKEIAKDVGLNTDSIVHITLDHVVEGIKRRLVLYIALKTISSSSDLSLTNWLATKSDNAIKLCVYSSITTSECTRAHYASTRCLIRVSGLQGTTGLKFSI